ncbi:MAG: hypothetical protein ACT4NV_14215 [Rhodoferax sp.]
MPTVREAIQTVLAIALILIAFAVVGHFDYEDAQMREAELEAYYHAMARCCAAAPALNTPPTNQPGESQ